MGNASLPVYLSNANFALLEISKHESFKLWQGKEKSEFLANLLDCKVNNLDLIGCPKFDARGNNSNIMNNCKNHNPGRLPANFLNLCARRKVNLFFRKKIYGWLVKRTEERWFNQNSFNFWEQHQITTQNSKTLISPIFAISNWTIRSGQVLTSVIKCNKISFKKNQNPDTAPEAGNCIVSSTFRNISARVWSFHILHQIRGSHRGSWSTICNRRQQLQYDYQFYQQHNRKQPIQQQ